MSLGTRGGGGRKVGELRKVRADMSEESRRRGSEVGGGMGAAGEWCQALRRRKSVCERNCWASVRWMLRV